MSNDKEKKDVTQEEILTLDRVEANSFTELMGLLSEPTRHLVDAEISRKVAESARQAKEGALKELAAKNIMLPADPQLITYVESLIEKRIADQGNSDNSRTAVVFTMINAIR